MPRSRTELMGLMFEAERLVRDGVARAEASRQLGVHVQTLAGWALRHGWRLKDIEAERAAKNAHATLTDIHASRREAAERAAEQAAFLAAYRRAVMTLGLAEAQAMLAGAPTGAEAQLTLEAKEGEV